jgi:hypothetical protein
MDEPISDEELTFGKDAEEDEEGLRSSMDNSSIIPLKHKSSFR